MACCTTLLPSTWPQPPLNWSAVPPPPSPPTTYCADCQATLHGCSGEDEHVPQCKQHRYWGDMLRDWQVDARIESHVADRAAMRTRLAAKAAVAAAVVRDVARLHRLWTAFLSPPTPTPGARACNEAAAAAASASPTHAAYDSTDMAARLVDWLYMPRHRNTDGLLDWTLVDAFTDVRRGRAGTRAALAAAGCSCTLACVASGRLCVAGALLAFLAFLERTADVLMPSADRIAALSEAANAERFAARQAKQEAAYVVARRDAVRHVEEWSVLQACTHVAAAATLAAHFRVVAAATALGMPPPLSPNHHAVPGRKEDLDNAWLVHLDAMCSWGALLGTVNNWIAVGCTEKAAMWLQLLDDHLLRSHAAPSSAPALAAALLRHTRARPSAREELRGALRQLGAAAQRLQALVRATALVATAALSAAVEEARHELAQHGIEEGGSADSRVLEAVAALHFALPLEKPLSPELRAMLDMLERPKQHVALVRRMSECLAGRYGMASLAAPLSEPQTTVLVAMLGGDEHGRRQLNLRAAAIAPPMVAGLLPLLRASSNNMGTWAEDRFLWPTMCMATEASTAWATAVPLAEDMGAACAAILAWQPSTYIAVTPSEAAAAEVRQAVSTIASNKPLRAPPPETDARLHKWLMALYGMEMSALESQVPVGDPQPPEPAVVSDCASPCKQRPEKDAEAEAQAVTDDGADDNTGVVVAGADGCTVRQVKDEKEMAVINAQMQRVITMCLTRADSITEAGLQQLCRLLKLERLVDLPHIVLTLPMEKGGTMRVTTSGAVLADLRRKAQAALLHARAKLTRGRRRT